MPEHYQLLPQGSNSSFSLYGVFAILGLMISLRYWLKSARHIERDDRFILIYFGALMGAFLGAKLAYIFAEGWLYYGENRWKYWLVGKSVTGALLGGFLGVEVIKKLVKYSRATGDRFALIIPMGIIIGRLGCLSHGCCGGIILASGKQWPAVLVEIGFNLIIWGILFLFYKKALFKNQLFHIYLISYGVFRFLHEFMRVTPKMFLGISGYQYIALLLIVVGVVAYVMRFKSQKLTLEFSD